MATSGPLESLSVLVARRAIQHADVVVMVIDASQGATDQDAAIAGEADRIGCGIVIAANKWDLMKQHGPDFYKEFDEKLRRQLKFLDYAPVMHISASTGERTPKLLETVDKVAAARMKRVPTPELNRFVRDVTAVHPPASPPGGRSGSSMPRRPAWRRRRSCFSPTSRRPFTFPISASC